MPADFYIADKELFNLKSCQTQEEVTAKSEESEGGGTAVLDFVNNLTYIDVNILERTGGGGGKPVKDLRGGGKH